MAVVQIGQDAIDDGLDISGVGVPDIGPKWCQVGRVEIRPLHLVYEIVVEPGSFLVVPQHLDVRNAQPVTIKSN